MSCSDAAPRDAENLVVVALAHALATCTSAGRSSRLPIRYPRRTSDDLAVGPAAARFARQRLVPARVELLAHGLERRDVAAAQRLEDLTVNQLDAGRSA